MIHKLFPETHVSVADGCHYDGWGVYVYVLPGAGSVCIQLHPSLGSLSMSAVLGHFSRVVSLGGGGGQGIPCSQPAFPRVAAGEK